MVAMRVIYPPLTSEHGDGVMSENEKPNWKAGDLLTTPEVAALLDVTPAWVSELCRQGRVPGAIRRGRFWFIPYEQVDKIKDLPMGRPPKD